MRFTGLTSQRDAEPESPLPTSCSCRMWEFYLARCEVGFRYRTNVVLQMQLTKRLDTVPITRDYMFDWERHGRIAGRREIGDIVTLGPE